MVTYMPSPRLRFAPSPDRPAASRLGRGRGRQRPGRPRPRRRAAAAHRRHRRGADGRGRRAGDPGRPRLARPGAQRARRCARARAAAQHVAAAEGLLATAHAYRCFCPPSQERYDGRCRALPRADAERRHEAGEANVVRFRVPSAEVVVDDATRGPVRFAGDEISDFVLVRADGRPTFDLATCVDDRDLAITHIVRGEDHLANSARHLLLLRALGAVEPVFAHCPIIVGADGERLSTRRGAEPLAALRARGVPPEAVVAFAAQLACPAQGGAGEVASFPELAQRFSLARLGRGTAHADPAHLAWLGREVLAGLPSEELARRLAPFLPQRDAGGRARGPRGGGARRLGARRGRRLCHRSGTATAGPPPDAAGARAVPRAARGRRARAPAVRRRRSSSSTRCARSARPAASRPRDVLHPLRIALTGAPHGLPLPVVVAVLPREEALERCRT